MAGKALYTGECQVCGKRHKVHGDHLAKHGYFVEWGTFNRICFGAKHQPFEKSKDLIDQAIAMTLKEAADIEAKIVKLQEPATAPQATCHIYFGHKNCPQGVKPGYRWVYGSIEERAPLLGMRFVLIAPDGKEHRIRADRHEPGILGAATYNNRLYSEHLSRALYNLQQYVEWQKRRISD